jgi:hypothetical protein
MSPPENISDPLFWSQLPLAIFAALVVLAFAWVVHRITEQRRDPDPRDQRQRSGDGGANTYDASSHSATTFTNNGEINIGARKMPGPE